jgi:hypothetical protein
MSLVLLLFLGTRRVSPAEVMSAHTAESDLVKVPCAQPSPASCPSKSTMAHRRLRKQIPADGSVAVHMQNIC